MEVGLVAVIRCRDIGLVIEEEEINETACGLQNAIQEKNGWNWMSGQVIEWRSMKEYWKRKNNNEYNFQVKKVDRTYPMVK